MKKLALAAALLAAFPASAQFLDTEIRTPLTGFEEVPSVSTRARGELVLRIDGNGGFVGYELSYSNLQGQVRQAHIHFAQTAVNGPIVIWLCGTSFNPGPEGTQPCPQSGTVRGTITSAHVLAAPATQLLAAGELSEMIAAFRAGAAYANVHSDLSPGGEIRGQIRP
jgi:CHRD domain-containing protein